MSHYDSSISTLSKINKNQSVSAYRNNSAQYDSHGKLQQSLPWRSSEADVVSAVSLGRPSTLTTSFQISLGTRMDIIRDLGLDEGDALGEVGAI